MTKECSLAEIGQAPNYIKKLSRLHFFFFKYIFRLKTAVND